MQEKMSTQLESLAIDVKVLRRQVTVLCEKVATLSIPHSVSGLDEETSVPQGAPSIQSNDTLSSYDGTVPSISSIERVRGSRRPSMANTTVPSSGRTASVKWFYPPGKFVHTEYGLLSAVVRSGSPDPCTLTTLIRRIMDAHECQSSRMSNS